MSFIYFVLEKVMAKSKRKKKKQSTAAANFLVVVIIVIFWLLLSVAFELPFLDLVKDTPDATQDPISTATATPTNNATPTPNVGNNVTPAPGTTATPTPEATSTAQPGTETKNYFLFVYKDGAIAYNEQAGYTYAGDLDKQALVRDALNKLATLLNYNVKYNTIILDENGLHVDLSATGAPFVKGAYIVPTGLFPTEYSTYDQEVFGILDSICFTAKDILGSNVGVFITMDGAAMDFGGQLVMDTTFSTDIPYLGYTYYHENYNPQQDVYSVAMNSGVPLTFATNVKYYFHGTIGTKQVDVTLTANLEADLVVIKLMSMDDTPMYVMTVDSNKVMVSDPSDTTVKIVLYQDGNDNLLGEWQTISGGTTLVDNVSLDFMRYELNQ